MGSDPFLGGVEQEADFLRLLRVVFVVCRAGHALGLGSRYDLREAIGLGELLGRLEGKTLEAHVVDLAEWVVLARARRLVGRLGREDGPTEPVVVVLGVDLAAEHLAELGRGELLFLEGGLRNDVEVSLDVVGERAGFALRLLVWLGIRVVQVDLDLLLPRRLTELPRADLGSLLELDVEAIMSVVRARRWLQLVLDQLARVLLSSHRHALEDVTGGFMLRQDGLRVVLADARVSLFEIDVDGYRLDVV